MSFFSDCFFLLTLNNPLPWDPTQWKGEFEPVYFWWVRIWLGPPKQNDQVAIWSWWKTKIILEVQVDHQINGSEIVKGRPLLWRRKPPKVGPGWFTSKMDGEFQVRNLQNFQGWKDFQVNHVKNFRGVLGCPWNLVTILSKLGCNLLRGLTTYLYRGYNLFIKFHGHPSRDFTSSTLPGVDYDFSGPLDLHGILKIKNNLRVPWKTTAECQFGYRRSIKTQWKSNMDTKHKHDGLEDVSPFQTWLFQVFIVKFQGRHNHVVAVAPSGIARFLCI